MKHYKYSLLSAILLTISYAPANQEGSDRMDHNQSRRITPTVLAVTKVLPSVVNISTESIVTQKFQRYRRADPFTKLFNRFFGLQQQQNKTNSLGSGVIVDPNGLVLTNNHVIQRASRIIVMLADGNDYEAKPIATDETSDLALLQLQGLPDGAVLAAATFSAPDDLLLGEQVITVGNPFGLGHSVASGILSAKKRKFIYDGDVLFNDIIQIDAAINPGNSGGPLVNADGELIGINLAIHGDAEGIGFAIPLGRIEEVLSKWLIPSRFSLTLCGLIPGTVTSEDGGTRAVVDDLMRDSPAAQTALKKGDIIKSVNGISVNQAIDVGRILWKLRSGESVRVSLASGATVEFATQSLPELSEEVIAQKRLKVEFQQLTPPLADALGLPYSRGLVVSDVKQGSILGRRGVRRGDVVIQVGEIPVTDFTDLFRSLRYIEEGEVVNFVVDRIQSVRGRRLLHRYILAIPL